MNNPSVSSVFVAGSGFMGSAIAYLIVTRSQANVCLYDKYPLALEKAKKTFERFGQTALEKNLIASKDLDNARNNLTTTVALDKLPESQLVIEAIAEDLSMKQELFKILDDKFPASTVFASNTSSLSITALAAATRRCDRFIGMHFFSPAHIMKLLEIIPAVDTSAATVKYVSDFAASLGKTVVTAKDFPGFITSRLGMVLLNEAAFALMEGLSTAEDIDRAMTLGYNHPMGPLALADFIGLDICLSIMETLHKGFGDSKYRPCPLFRQLVAAGHLGKKTGKGFYDYGAVV
jgi:3-hydroxybutyryl-CoA dehydrogenase